jgi:predicted translin family RNA/ssDNA-binding protein
VYQKEEKIAVKRPEDDFGTYEQVDRALCGASSILEKLRRNYGTVGFASQNKVSDLSKAAITASINGDDEAAERFLEELDGVLSNLDAARLPEDLAGYLADRYAHALPQGIVSDFFRNSAQEFVEAKLFTLMWPVVLGKEKLMPTLPTMHEFSVTIQAILAGYLDVTSEMAKSLDLELEKSDITIERELELLKRFLKIARSIHLYLSSLRHAPQYVINNSHIRGQGFKSRLYRIQGMLARMSQRYSDRLSQKRHTDQILKSVAPPANPLAGKRVRV